VKTLRLSADLTLPIDAVTQAIGILAKRRAGKSYAARRLAEQLFKAGQQIVIVDPKGDWWGIRSSADGKSPGLPVVILGGERGDVPLEVNAGEIVAKLVTEERVSVLLDLSLFRKHEVTTFMTAFLENLYRLKAREIYRTPLMLFIDEADAIAPQKPQENQARMLGAAEDIVRRGGQRGVGCTLITQRSAVLNKNVLTQVEMLIALRTIAPQDLKALDAWVEVHGEKEQRDTLMVSLPALPTGDAWFWSPGWPTADGIFQRVHVSRIETFDSGATPKSGEKRVEPKNLADVDLDSLTRQMAATIEKAKADDPKELRKQIAHLRSELTVAQRAVQKTGTLVERKVVDQEAIDRAVVRALSGMGTRIKGEVTHVRRALVSVVNSAQGIVEALTPAIGRIDTLLTATNGDALVPATTVATKTEARPAPSSPIAHREKIERRFDTASDVQVGRTPKRMLDAMALLAALGVDQPYKRTVAGHVGITHTSGTFSNYLRELRGAGLILNAGDNRLELTDEGRAVATEPETPPTLQELHRIWLGKVGSTPARMLSELIDEYPNALSKEELGSRVGITHTSGTFSTYLSELRTPGLIEDTRNKEVKATELLFPEGLR
jgi:hypothetical protein